MSRDRNGTSTFALRARKNLDFIVERARGGEDVHPVTQAVTALLGIIVFPWEMAAFDVIKRKKLPLLRKEGWPKWEMTGSRRVLEVQELVHVLRNAVAHGSIEFDSDSADPAAVMVSFTNVPEGANQSDWVGRIRADHLIEFCRCFTSAIENEAG